MMTYGYSCYLYKHLHILSKQIVYIYIHFIYIIIFYNMHLFHFKVLSYVLLKKNPKFVYIQHFNIH